MKKLLLSFIGGVFLINLAQGVAQPIKIVEGKDYTILTTPVQKTAEPKGKVNVKEFFSFTCIHCKDIEPLVDQYLATNKAVDLDKIQVIWGDEVSKGFAKLNATFEIMGLNKLYVPAFNTIFTRTDLNNSDNLKKFLVDNGLTKAETDKFMATYNSFTVSSKESEYKALTDKYNITGTPTFIVADKYVASPALPEKLIQVVKALVDKALAEQGANKKNK